MKKTILSICVLAILMVAASGCRKDIYGCTDPTAANYNRNANVDNNSCYYYNVSFWTNINNEPPITVSLYTVTGTITTTIVSGIPDCNTSGCAHFSLPVGSYNYTATSTTTGHSWTGTAVATNSGCNLYQLQ